MRYRFFGEKTLGEELGMEMGFTSEEMVGYIEVSSLMDVRMSS